MQSNQIIFPNSIFDKSLKIINDIKFTQREIDIIAVILTGRAAKPIAQFLSISPKTVESHIHNIMIKLECNSRSGILDFIEKSDKLSHIRKHYSSLIRKQAFERKLQEFSLSESQSVFIYGHKKDILFLHLLGDHLKLLGFSTSIILNNEQDSKVDRKNKQESKIIDVLSETPTPTLQSANIKKYSEHTKSTQKPPVQPSIIVMLNSEIITENLEKIKISNDLRYYFSFFELLKKLSINIKFEEVILDFKKQCEIDQDFSIVQNHIRNNEIFKEKHKRNISELFIFNNNNIILKIILLILFLAIILSWKSYSIIFQTSSVRSDLLIPSKPFFLTRSTLTDQLKKKLNVNSEIQVVAIIGLGGAGKTTLARNYALQQNAKIVWEINAETKESLRVSFESLAYNLAKTNHDKKILKEIEDIKNSIERERKVILFVKEKLISYQRWLLIYDNVEKFTDIHKHFPLDASTWGKGDVIITTRDDNIQNVSHVNETLHIGELDLSEQLILFTKIINNGKMLKGSTLQEEETKKFLKNLPPFPLDISIAAYYLKATGITYKKYLEHLNTDHLKEFSLMQKTLLNEASNYEKTRYSILTLSLNQIMNTHKYFPDLLLFISLLDSQKIPIELLNAYKNDILLETFIYNLKKYSLITIEPSGSSFIMHDISVHRSTQEIALAYLIKILDLKNDKHLTKSIADVLENYLADIIEKEDFIKMKSLIIHTEVFLKHDGLLTEIISETIKGELGCLYSNLGDYIRAKDFLENSLRNFKKNNFKNYIRITQFLDHLGNVYRELGNYEEAKNILEESLVLYKKHLPENTTGIARALAYLGNVYRNMGKVEEARGILEESLSLYKKYLPNNQAGIARALANLGVIHRELSNYEKAKNILEESLTLYQKYSPENYTGIARTLAYLGSVYLELGNYEKARDALEKSLNLYQKHSPENQAAIARVLMHVGNAYKELGNYKKSKNLLEQSFDIYKQHFSHNHIDIAWVSACLGKLFIELGEYKEAKTILQKSLQIYKKTLKDTHIDIAWISAYLGDACRELGDYEEARKYLEQSLYVYKKHFGENHIDTARTLCYLGAAYRDMGRYEEAKDFLSKAKIIYVDFYGENHIQVAHLLNNLGQLYHLKKNAEYAEKLFNISLQIFIKQNHPGLFRSLENLTNLYSEISLTVKNIEKKQDLTKQSIVYLKQALKTVQYHYPTNSPHIERIKNKLENLMK